MRRLLLLVLLAACATRAETVRLDNGPARPPVPPDSVRIFTAREAVTSSFVEIALLNAEGTGWAPADEAKVIERMREEAGKLGANAIILGGPALTSGSEVNVKVNRWHPTRGRSIAIYIKPESQ